MDDFKKLIDNSLLQKVAIAGGTIGIREIVDFVDLKCPCLEEYNVVYAWCSMLIPALVFFLVGLLPMRRMCGYSSFRYFASICGRTKGVTTEHPFSPLSFSCEKGKRTECCYNLCSHLNTALVAPITWIIAVHLQGDLFICANATQNYTSLPCKDPEKEILNENQKNFLSESKAHSQMIGWIFMAGAITFLVLSIFCNRCVDANIVINKKYMDAAYDALNDEFYKCKKKKAISDLKKKLKKKRVQDRPAKHLGDYAAIPLMERCRVMTSVRNDIPAANVCSPASHSSGVEAETHDLPADLPSFCSRGARRDLFPASHSFGVQSAAVGHPQASQSFGVERATSDLPALRLSSGDEDSEDTDEEWNNIVNLYKRA